MKILLATDGSSDAEKAAKFLCRLRCTEPVEVVVLTSVYLPGVHSGEFSDRMLEECREHQAHYASENIKRAKALLEGLNATVNEKIVEGPVGQSIVEAAEQIDADLIVIGAKGHSAIHRVLLGSVSNYVASNADCSVLVMRPSEEDDGELSLTLAVDDSAPSKVAIEQVKKLDWGASAEGQLLSVVPVFRFYRQDLVPSEVEHRKKEREAARVHADSVIEQLREYPTKFTPNVIEAEHVGEAIVDFVESHSTGLVVVGDGDQSLLGRMFLGSVSDYVVHHAPCSVLIARRRS